MRSSIPDEAGWNVGETIAARRLSSLVVVVHELRLVVSVCWLFHRRLCRYS